MRKSLIGLVVAFMLMGAFSAQGQEESIYASHSILSDVLAQVAGDVVEVRSLIPPGADVHAFQMPAREVARLLDAKLLFVNGASFETGLLGQILEAAPDLPTVSVSDCVALWHVLADEEFAHDDHGHGEDDDHDEHDDHGDAMAEDADHHDDEEADEHADHDDDEEADEHADHDDDEEADEHADHDDDEEADEHADHDDDEDMDEEADHHDDEDAHAEEADHHDEAGDDHAVEECHEVRAELGLPEVPDETLIVAANCEGDSHAHGEHGEGEHGEEVQGCDPHVWMDPQNVLLWTVKIRDTLSELMPEHAEVFAANAAAYLDEVRALDAELAERTALAPPPRLVVTQHDVMGYFVTRYDLDRAMLLESFSTLAEANPAQLAELLDTLRERGVKGLLGEAETNNQPLEQVANELGIPVFLIYGDSLSAADEPGATYLDYMRANMSSILSALHGEAR